MPLTFARPGERVQIKKINGMDNAKKHLYNQTLFAYAVALVIYQAGLLFSGAAFTAWTAVAILLVLAMGFRLFRKPPHDRLGRNAEAPASEP